MLNFVHYLPTKLYFGKGQIENLRAEVAQYGKKVLMVYGGGSIKRNDIYGQVMEQLEGFTVFELAGIKPNPRLDTCKQGIALCKQKGIDLVLAVGGGSAMDTAKCIACLLYTSDAADD